MEHGRGPPGRSRGWRVTAAGPAGEVEVAGPVLPALVRDWPVEAREELAERAAILEYDARMERGRAERAAEHVVRDQWSRRSARST